MTVPTGALDTHLADRATAAAVTLRTGGSGVVLGRDERGAPAAVALFRPEPTTGVLVGPLALAQLVAFRSLAVGAAITVETHRPATWQNFVRLAAGQTGHLRTVARAEDDEPGTVDRPRLLLVDAESAAGVEAHRPGAWATVLTAHPQASSWNAPLLAAADVALLRSLSTAEARLVAGALNLPAATRPMTGADPGLLVVASRAGWRRLRIAPTDVEQWLIGDLTG